MPEQSLTAAKVFSHRNRSKLKSYKEEQINRVRNKCQGREKKNQAEKIGIGKRENELGSDRTNKIEK